MKKKTTFILILLIGILIFPNQVLAQDFYQNPSDDPENRFIDYVIDSYNIDIKVNENNTFDIHETISVYFNYERHGIFRKIPLKNEVSRLDGTVTKNRAKVSDVEVSHEYETSFNIDEYEIKIGSPDYTLTGKQVYDIRYKYKLDKDPLEDKDEFYFNIIGPEWDTTIGNVTFTIEMPKTFDSSKLGFSSGDKGSTDSSLIEYTVDENTIRGKYLTNLYPRQALTVRLELEEGYFVGAGFNNTPLYIALYLIPLVCLIICIILWSTYGNDDDVVETIEFYPPTDINSLEAGMLFKGKATNEDAISLLIYLANKGYIKIEEIEKNKLFNKTKDFKIIKLKDYDGNNKNERLFFEGLFKKTKYKGLLSSVEQNTYKESVTSKDLYDKFYKTLNKILTNVNDQANINKVFEKGSISKRVYVILLILISITTTVAIPSYEYGGGEMIFISIFLIGFYAIFFSTIIFAKMNKVAKVLIIFFLCFHAGAFMLVLPISSAITDNINYLFTTLFGFACVIGMLIINNYMPKRTPYGNEMLGKLKGFKTFLETAEKEKLESMVFENPNYFYDILPYTYVLGVSDKWINKFEKIALKEPDWYSGMSSFDSRSFGESISHTMKSATSSMSSSPSSSGGGGFSSGISSGGGSSGGGSGGGGGGSW